MAKGKSFYEKMEALDDVKLLKVVKLKDEYQEEAAEAAITVAIKRGLINEDLSVVSSDLEEKEDIKQAVTKAKKMGKERVENEKKNKNRLIRRVVIVVVIFIVALSFHIIPSRMMIFPKGNLTFMLYDNYRK